MIVFPADAEEISAEARGGDVDDWDPTIRINGSVFYTKGGGGTFTINKAITNLRAGNNRVHVRAFNKHTYFSVFFRISGTYKASTCTHVIRFLRLGTWTVNR
jgi:hypothetical protein